MRPTNTLAVLVPCLAVLTLTSAGAGSAAAASSPAARTDQRLSDAASRLQHAVGRPHQAQVTKAGTVRLTVELAASADPDAVVAAATAAGGRIRHRHARLHALSLDVPAAAVDHVRTALDHRPGVAGVTTTPLRTLSYMPNDPDLARQGEYLDAIGARTAWDQTHGSGQVTIAVVDSGLDITHPDFVRADGSSKVVATYDAVTGGSDVSDAVGHGTAVAGVAAAATDNLTGLAGVGFDTSLIAVKVADASGDVYADDTAAGVVWAADHGADVINLSLGSAVADPAEVQAVQYAVGKGVVVVAAAGNEARSSLSYPAALPGVVAVGATTGSSRASFSNYGSWVDVGAPGTGIEVTAPVAGSTYFTPSYDSADGTSFSSPLVAGAAALLAAAHPEATGQQLADALGNSTTPGAYGFAHGLVNIPSALRYLAPKPLRITAAAPSPFSPNGDGKRDTFRISYTTSEPLTMQATVQSSDGAVVKVQPLGAVGVGATAWEWNGRDSSGLVARDGAYSVRLTATTADGSVSEVATTAVLDATPAALSSLGGANSTFYPASDGYRDAFAAAVTSSEPLATLQLRIYSGAGALLRTVQTSAAAGRTTLTWNGRRGDGSVYPAGTYRFAFVATDGAQNTRATARYGFTLSLKRITARTGSVTLTPSQSRTQLLVGDCSLVRGPAYASGWVGSYDLLSDYYYPDCAGYQSTSDLAASVHGYTLPAAIKYGNVKVTTYGRSFPHYADTAVMLYFDRNDDPTSSGRVLGATAGSYAATSVPPSYLINGRTLHWSVSTAETNWYQVKSFTVTWTYYVLV